MGYIILYIQGIVLFLLVFKTCTAQPEDLLRSLDSKEEVRALAEPRRLLNLSQSDGAALVALTGHPWWGMCCLFG